MKKGTSPINTAVSRRTTLRLPWAVVDEILAIAKANGEPVNQDSGETEITATTLALICWGIEKVKEEKLNKQPRRFYEPIGTYKSKSLRPEFQKETVVPPRGEKKIEKTLDKRRTG